MAMMSRNENKVHPGDCGINREGIMTREEGEKSDQMFVSVTLASFGLELRGGSSEHRAGSSCLTISLMLYEESPGLELLHQCWSQEHILQEQRRKKGSNLRFLLLYMA